MSVQTQHRQGREYIYFYYYENGKHRSFSLGRKGNPNVSNIYKAAEIVAEQKVKYESMHQQLLGLLPQEERRRLPEAKEPYKQVMDALPLLVARSRGSPAVIEDVKKELEKLAEKERKKQQDRKKIE